MQPQSRRMIPLSSLTLCLVVFLYVCAFSTASVSYTAAALADEVIDLPGLLQPIAFRHFSGYLDVPGAYGNSIRLHYWLTEAEKNATKAPLVYWTNGGPGCSGLIGMFLEHGPFRPSQDGSIALNEWSWNKLANVVYIEQPCGVGFSYSTGGYLDDFSSSDEQAALTNYHAAQAFLDRFPHLRANPFHLASESYGGHYVPWIATAILAQNALNAKALQINLKGVLIGNPYTNVESGYPSMVEALWGHQLLPRAAYLNYKALCTTEQDFLGYVCSGLANEMFSRLGTLDPYALDADACLLSAQRLRLQSHFLAASARLKGAQRKALAYSPCSDSYLAEYLNRAEVKRALHVQEDIAWQECSDSMEYRYSDMLTSITPVFRSLLSATPALDVLIYSGDDDSVVSTQGTQKWITELQLEEDSTKAWVPYIVHAQIAGFLTTYRASTFKFLTIRKAGHEVPAFEPAVAFDVLRRYLWKKWDM